MKPQMIHQLLEVTASEYPEIPALGYAGEPGAFTYRQARAGVEELAARLVADGVAPGDRVAILSENMPNWGIAYLAINRCGAVIVPILPDFGAEEIRNILDHSRAARVFVSEKLAPRAEAAGFSVARGNAYKLDELSLSPNSPVAELVPASQATHAPAHDGKPDDLAAIIYTSGTTGHSKGVMLSNRNIVFDVVKTSVIPGMKPGHTLLSILPLAHTYECTIGFLIPLYMGCSVYYLRRPPSATVLLPALKAVRPHLMLSVPLLIEKLYRQSVLPSITRKGLMSRLHGTAFGRRILHRFAGRKLRRTFGGRLYFFGIGGAGLAPEVERFLIEAKFPYAIGYGLTETSPLIAGANSREIRFGSTGRPIEGIDVRIADPHPETGEGEILVRGPIVMQGYYRDPERTAEVIDGDRWFHTGDLGVFDGAGRLFIRGRAKNMILGPSGENIYPEEIESVINSHVFVEDSLVFEEGGRLLARVHVNYDQLSEHLGSAVAAVPGSIGDFLAELRNRVNARLSRFSRIGQVIEQKEPFDKTPTSKIRRFLYDRTRPADTGARDSAEQAPAAE